MPGHSVSSVPPLSLKYKGNVKLDGLIHDQALRAKSQAGMPGHSVSSGPKLSLKYEGNVKLDGLTQRPSATR